MTAEDRAELKRRVDAAKRARLARARTEPEPEWRGFFDRYGKRILSHSEHGYGRGCRCSECVSAERDRGERRRRQRRAAA